jgi:hypothetical protein
MTRVVGFPGIVQKIRADWLGISKKVLLRLDGVTVGELDTHQAQFP